MNDASRRWRLNLAGHRQLMLYSGLPSCGVPWYLTAFLSFAMLRYALPDDCSMQRYWTARSKSSRVPAFIQLTFPGHLGHKQLLHKVLAANFVGVLLKSKMRITCERWLWQSPRLASPSPRNRRSVQSLASVDWRDC